MAHAMQQSAGRRIVMLKKVLIATLLIGGTTAMADPQRDWDRRGDYDRHGDYDRRVDEGHKAGTWRTLATRSANGAERRFVEIGGRAAGDLHVLRFAAVRGVASTGSAAI